jgi:glycine dehydrogenase subunit 2
MKYSPLINEQIAGMPQMAELHPSQPDATVQGLLEIVHRFDLILRAISGMDRFSFQPGGGAQAIFANALVIRAFHESRGDGGVRDEIITTAFSHPADAACPAVAGYRVIELVPGPAGYPELDALRAALSSRTAGLMITNPEDTGIFNPYIEAFTAAVHEVGGLCAYDQANANGILGITRARDAGFDLCHFNLHKTFSSPHGSVGPATGALGVTSDLERFLPIPLVSTAEDGYRLDYERPDSVGRVRSFHGNFMNVLKAYAWTVALGPEGLKTVAETAVLNNNYLTGALSRIDGITVPYPDGGQRLEQTRYSWDGLHADTGFGTDDLNRRVVDFGLQSYFTSHHPMIVPEPFTLEPSETLSRDDLDEYAGVFEQIASEAREHPELIESAPHAAAIGRFDEDALSDPDRWAFTWRRLRRVEVGRA